MTGVGLGLGMLAIGFGSILLAIVGTVAVIWVKSWQASRKPPEFKVITEEQEDNMTEQPDYESNDEGESTL